MRTADARLAARRLAARHFARVFVVVYFVVFGAGTVYMLRLIAQGPGDTAPRRQPATEQPGQPAGRCRPRPTGRHGDGRADNGS